MSEDERGNASVLTMHLGTDITESPYILPLVRQLHRESYFRDVPFRHESYDDICRNLVENKGRFGAIYIEIDQEPGAFAYFFVQNYMGSGLRVTTIHTFYIRADLRGTATGAAVWDRLKTGIRAWSLPRESSAMMFHVQSGIDVDAIDTFLRMQGATHLGGNYIMRI
ncbi:MAG: hypothetical protein ACNA7O_04940 [Rhodobacterales bacterium]